MDASRLRALGYMLDGEDRWVHPRLKLELQDPDALLACNESDLEVFHDGSLWAELEPAPRPALDFDLSSRVARLELSWDGWLRAWELQEGLYASHEQLVEMGDRLEGTLAGLRRWQEGHDRRLVGSCMGMAAMLLWLLGGWAFGVSAWLGGVAFIAVATWLVRPRSRPDSLFGNLDVELVPKALAAGRDAVAAIPVDGEHVRLSVLERNVAVSELKRAFQPEVLGRILHSVAPVD